MQVRLQGKITHEHIQPKITRQTIVMLRPGSLHLRMVISDISRQIGKLTQFVLQGEDSRIILSISTIRVSLHYFPVCLIQVIIISYRMMIVTELSDGRNTQPVETPHII